MKSLMKTTKAWTAASLIVLVAVGAVPGGANASIEPECTKKDNSAGFGGQKVSCGFRCRTLDAITVTAHADDEDATVKGDAICGGVKAHCDEGDRHCEATVAGVKENDWSGTCVAKSEEFFDSGLRVTCKSVGSSTPDDDLDVGVPPGVPQWCPVRIEPSPPYPSVCLGAVSELDDSCAMVSGCGVVVDLCGDAVAFYSATAVDEAVCDGPPVLEWIGVGNLMPTQVSSVQIFMGSGVATAFACEYRSCIQVPPVCTIDDGSPIASCRV